MQTQAERSRSEPGARRLQGPLDLRRRGRATGLTAEVVLLTSDSVTELEWSLAATRRAASAAGAQILFIDLGSSQATKTYVAASMPRARAVWLRRDDSLMDALEAAASASEAEVLVVVDAALRPSAPDAIVRLQEHLAANPTAMAVAPDSLGVFAVRRPDLMEVLQRRERPLRTQADLFLELRLQGRELSHIQDGGWLAATDHPEANAPPRGAMRTRPLILHVAECFAAGTERHLLDLVRYLEDFDHVLAVPSHHHGESTARAAALAEAAGARIERVEMNRATSPRAQTQALLTLRGLVRRLAPDVVHGHSSIGGAMARLATLGIPVPVVYTPHAVSRSRWALAVERRLRTRTDRHIAVSESERDFILANGLASSRQVAVIPNGIDLSPPPPLEQPLRDRLGIPQDAPLIGYVGRLTWQKAPEVFVSACAIVSDRLPGAHFVLIGSGPLSEQMEAWVAQTGAPERFHLLPSLPGAAAALEELDVYAAPSRFEGGPYTPVEAMRAGTPVVVTDVAGNRDVVEHWVSGLIVPQDEPHALAAAMLTVLQDSALRARLVEGARRSLHRFEVRAMAAATAKLYRELCRLDSLPARVQASEDLRVPAHAPLPGELPGAFESPDRELLPAGSVV